MLITLICLAILYTVLKIAKDVFFVKKILPTFFIVTICILKIIVISYFSAPTTVTTYRYGICQIAKTISETPGKSNTDIVRDLEDNVKLSYDSIIIEQIRYKHSKLNYLITPLPAYALRNLVNRNNTYLK